MQNGTSITALEKDIADETDTFLSRQFERHQEFKFPLYHYTQDESAKKIITSQSFHASLIISTSDPLEFAAPFAACRDWFLFHNPIWIFPTFPIEFFKHFNEEALSPSLRPYFVSLSHNPNSTHLKSFYGNETLKLLNQGGGLNDLGFIIRVKYHENPQTLIQQILESWTLTVLIPILEKHRIENAMHRFSEWFYLFMKVCHTSSLAVKQKSFQNEEEVRLIVYSNDPDLDQSWHARRALKTTTNEFERKREYLPLLLNNLNLYVSKNL